MYRATNFATNEQLIVYHQDIAGEWWWKNQPLKHGRGSPASQSHARFICFQVKVAYNGVVFIRYIMMLSLYIKRKNIVHMQT